MRIYISNLGYEYIAKNKAEEAAQKVFESMNHRILRPENLSPFKKEFFDKIGQVNLDHPRSRDLDLRFSNHGQLDPDGAIHYEIEGVAVMDLYWGEE